MPVAQALLDLESEAVEDDEDWEKVRTWSRKQWRMMKTERKLAI